MKTLELFVVLVSALAFAGDAEFTDILGQPQRPFEKIDKAAVFIFITHDCPIANKFAPEIKRLHAAYSTRGVRFYLVHAEPEFKPEAAKKHAQEFGYTCPILIDTQHALVKRAGATITPEAAVFSPGGTLQYRGRINDIYVDLGKSRTAPTRHDLKDALNSILAGTPVKTPRTPAIGCQISDLEPQK